MCYQTVEKPLFMLRLRLSMNGLLAGGLALIPFALSYVEG